MIRSLMAGQHELFNVSQEIEELAQNYAAQIIQVRHKNQVDNTCQDYREVDVDSLEMVRPRSVSCEHVALEAFNFLKPGEHLKTMGFNGPQLAAATGTIIGRMCSPGSELATHYRLQNVSGLGELINYDLSKINLYKMYTVSNQLLKNKEAIEKHLYLQEKNLFESSKATIVMDAGIATEDNIKWLKENGYPYIVVSRKRHRQFTEDDAVVVKQDDDGTVKAQKVIDPESNEVLLYCHSTKREAKEQAINDRSTATFEQAMTNLDSGLHKNGCLKKL